LPGAGLYHGQHGHGPFIDARRNRDISAQWPESVLGNDAARHSRHDIGARAAGFRSDNAGNGRDLLHAIRANHARDSGSVSYFLAGGGRRHRDASVCGTDDTSSDGFHVHDVRAALAVRTTSYVVYVRFSGLDGTGDVVHDSSASAFHCCNGRTDAIDHTKHGLPIHDGQHSHDDPIDHDDVIDGDDVIDPVGDHSHANRRQHDRDHIAGVPGRQRIDHRMRHHAGRPADQRRRFAALDPRSSEQSPAWRDSTHSRGAWGHQHRSDNGRDAHAEYVGLRRERDHESVDARHDGAGQRHRRRGDARCIACVAIGLLTEN
jgi:hypothetical protein